MTMTKNKYLTFVIKIRLSHITKFNLIVIPRSSAATGSLIYLI